MEVYPVGARCWVEEIQPVDEYQEFTNRTGIHLVQLETQTPRPTTGKVVAVGNDSYLNELVRVGDIVFFGKYAGEYVTVKGVQYRCLEVQDIKSVARGTVEELEELTKPPNTPSSPFSSSSS